MKNNYSFSDMRLLKLRKLILVSFLVLGILPVIYAQNCGMIPCLEGNLAITIPSTIDTCAGTTIIIDATYGGTDTPPNSDTNSYFYKWYKTNTLGQFVEVDLSSDKYSLVGVDNLQINGATEEEAGEYLLELQVDTDKDCFQCSNNNCMVSITPINTPNSISIGDQFLNCDDLDNPVSLTPQYNYPGGVLDCPEAIEGVSYEFTWLKDDDPLSNLFEYQFDTCGGLTINALKMSDVGIYKLSVNIIKEGDVVSTITGLANLSIQSPSVDLSVVESTEKCSATISLNLDGAEASSIKWLFNGVIDNTLSNNTSIVVDQDGNYEAVVTFQNGCVSNSNNGIVALERPGIPVVLDDQGSNSPFQICQDSFTNLIATAEKAERYVWSWEGNTREEQETTFLYEDLMPSATNAVTVIAYSSNQCESITSVEITTIGVDGIPPCNVNISEGVPQILNCLEVEPSDDWQLIDSINIASILLAPDQGNVSSVQATLMDDRSPGGLIYEVTPKQAGCSGEAVTISITVVPSVEDAPFIPEVISPNGDGINDSWQIIFPDFENDQLNYSIQIYNRLGGLVYDRSDYTEQWDATNCADGTYYYILTNEKEERKFTGAVTVIGKN